MITVKAYPEISLKHRETVCVAGIRLDTSEPEHVRLFPLPFRYLGDELQFRKYDVIELDVKPADDGRPESFRPIAESIRIVDHIDPGKDWKLRSQYIRPLIASSYCHVTREQKLNGTSLGVFRPAEITDFILTPKAEPRSPRLEMMARQGDLLDPDRKYLEALPYRFQYRFRCNEAKCPGHLCSLFDWEVGVFYLRVRKGYPEAELADRMRAKWFDEIASPGKDTHFFIGNLHKYPWQFSLLGVFYPPRGVLDQEQLF